MSLDNRTLQTVGMAGAAASAAIAALAVKYHDRPLFYEHPKGIAHQGGLPILGNLTYLLGNIHRLYDFQLEQFEKVDALTMYVSLPPLKTWINE